MRFGGGGESREDTRPTPRVLLLAGPPGAGKTTLVHILARHCGYRPFEINASDDRTGAVVGQRVRDAVTMQAVIGERKPNLVVVDEVDGAAGGAEGRSAVAALLRIVSDDGGVGGGGGGGGSRSTPSKFKLSRPIICICNDPFVMALKPLREVAQLVHVRPPVAERLLPRVQAVCAAEGVRASRAALSAVVERSGNDVRSCLNALQLLANRKKREHGSSAVGGFKGRGGGADRSRASHIQAAEITPRDVEAMQMASKDVESSAFKVWEEIFFKETGPGVAGSGVRSSESPAERLNRRMQVHFALALFFLPL
jgi:chromosome transmission fidelity protein 18